uniref:Uncharacterized protein n=1 Tax=Oryza barthii TaxID=65489 RepID=A0A0D3HC72_9ORYZ
MVTRQIAMYQYTKRGIDEPTHIYLNTRSYMDPMMESLRERTSMVWDAISLPDDSHPLHIHMEIEKLGTGH